MNGFEGLIRDLADGDSSGSQTQIFLFGQISSVSGSTADVNVAGSALTELRYPKGSSPVAGDTCVIARFGAAAFIMQILA